MPKEQNKNTTILNKSLKYLANLGEDQISSPNYIPDNIQIPLGKFLRNGRKKFDVLDKKLRSVEKDSDEFLTIQKEIEGIAKSFVTAKKQIDVFKSGQGAFKSLVPNLNIGTKSKNFHVNSVIFGEQMDEFVIDDRGKFNFGIEASPKEYYKLDNLQDNVPVVTEPYQSKSFVYKKYEEMQLGKRLGKTFDDGVEYNKILYNIKQFESGTPGEIIGLAHTDLVGDNSVSSFAEMWEDGLADESLYIDPKTGNKLPKDSKWMKEPENVEVLSQKLARHITNGMRDVASVEPQINPTNVYGDEYGTADDNIVVAKELEEIVIKGERDKDDVVVAPTLPEVTIEEKRDVDKEVDDYLKPDKKKKEKLSDKVKTMPPRLFDRYMDRLKKQLDKAKKGDKKSKKEWEKFLKTLPGGDYYGLLKSMKIWRKDKLTPSQLLKKYSK